MLLDKLKALAAALVGFLCSWASLRFPQVGQFLTPEIQATIVGAVVGLIVHQVPNIQKPAAS